jgi:hypothetical protein
MIQTAVASDSVRPRRRQQHQLSASLRASAALSSGVRARVGRVLWLRVGQALTFRASDNQRRACAVAHPARVVTERKLIDVARQMAPADVVERSNDAALQQSEETFHGVRVDVPAHVFATAVNDRIVLAESHRQRVIDVQVIAHHVRVQTYFTANHVLHVVAGDAGQRESAYSSAAFHKGNDGRLLAVAGGRASGLVLARATDVGLDARQN